MKQLIITCEHGGNDIPVEYQYLFKDAEQILKSHRGWDPGALGLAKDLQENLGAPFFFSKTSRLLVELNRSLNHPLLFSEFTRNLSATDKKTIILEQYLPYRNNVEDKIESIIYKGISVIHLSIHSFTPVLHGVKRNCEIGLLYDPQKVSEKSFCKEWRFNLNTVEKDWKIRMNYPYKGTSDGFTTFLRKKFPFNYSGIELEINQALLQQDQKKVNRAILRSLEKTRI